MDRTWRSGRRELHDAAAVTADEIGIEPPPQALIEALRAIEVGHRDDDDLEFHVGHLRAGDPGGLFAADLCAAHGDLLDSDAAAFSASSPRLAPSTRLKAGYG